MEGGLNLSLFLFNRYKWESNRCAHFFNMYYVEYNCAFVSTCAFKAHFSVDFIERLSGCVDISRNVLEGIDRLPWETHSAVLLLTLVSRSLVFSHLPFDTYPFRLHWANHSLSLLRIPQVVKCDYHKRIVTSSNFLLLKHSWMNKARFMLVTDLKENCTATTLQIKLS